MARFLLFVCIQSRSEVLTSDREVGGLSRWVNCWHKTGPNLVELHFWVEGLDLHYEVNRGLGTEMNRSQWTGPSRTEIQRCLWACLYVFMCGGRAERAAHAGADGAVGRRPSISNGGLVGSSSVMRCNRFLFLLVLLAVGKCESTELKNNRCIVTSPETASQRSSYVTAKNRHNNQSVQEAGV